MQDKATYQYIFTVLHLIFKNTEQVFLLFLKKKIGFRASVQTSENIEVLVLSFKHVFNRII